MFPPCSSQRLRPLTYYCSTSHRFEARSLAGPAVILGIQITLALYRELTEAAHAVDITGRGLNPKTCITMTTPDSKVLEFLLSAQTISKTLLEPLTEHLLLKAALTKATLYKNPFY